MEVPVIIGDNKLPCGTSLQLTVMVKDVDVTGLHVKPEHPFLFIIVKASGKIELGEIIGQQVCETTDQQIVAREDEQGEEVALLAAGDDQAVPCQGHQGRQFGVVHAREQGGLQVPPPDGHEHHLRGAFPAARDEQSHTVQHLVPNGQGEDGGNDDEEAQGVEGLVQLQINKLHVHKSWIKHSQVLITVMDFLTVHGVGGNVLVPIHDDSGDTQQPGGALHHQGDNAGPDHCHLQPGQSIIGDSDVSLSIQDVWKALLFNFRCGDIVAFTAIVFRKNMSTILANLSTHMNKAIWRFIREQVLLHNREWENHAGKCQSQHHHQCNQLVGQDVPLPHHGAVREVLPVTVESTLVSAHVVLLPEDEVAGSVLLLSQVPTRTEEHDGHRREEHQHRAAHDSLEGYHLHHDSQILKGKFDNSEKDK